MSAPHIGIDTTANLTSHVDMLVREGVRFASRYLRSAGIKKPEADAIRAASINLILNYEGRGDDINAFGAAEGTRDATYAMGQAQALGAPVGTAIYFSCEPSNYGNLTSAYASRVLPYWRSVNAVLAGHYRVGAYSFGLYLDWLLRDHATEFCWLPNASGWPGYREFLASNRWHYLQRLPSNVNFNGLLVDWDDPNPAMSDIGAWMASAPPAPDTDPAIPTTFPTLWRRKPKPNDAPLIEIAVKYLQEKLGTVVDGFFWDATETEVKAFQAAHGLVVDGIMGTRSWAALLAKVP